MTSGKTDTPTKDEVMAMLFQYMHKAATDFRFASERTEKKLLQTGIDTTEFAQYCIAREQKQKVA